LSEKLGKQKNASILLATDPDADRVSVKVKNSIGEYIFLSGNQSKWQPNGGPFSEVS